MLVSAQVGGRVETLNLTSYTDGILTFDSTDIENDEDTIRSQRIIHLSSSSLKYELNMNTKKAPSFQNHLAASLTREV